MEATTRSEPEEGLILSASSVSTYLDLARLPKDDLDRIRAACHFWIHVDTSSEHGCWEWQAGTDAYGYGQFQSATPGRYSGPFSKWGAKVHRAAWIFTYGPIGNGLHVLHRCDNRLCVRPDHLELGTPAENARQAVVRNRGSGRPKITLEQAAAIRSADMKYGDGRRLARELGVHPQTISRIRVGKNRRGGDVNGVQ